MTSTVVITVEGGSMTVVAIRGMVVRVVGLCFARSRDGRAKELPVEITELIVAKEELSVGEGVSPILDDVEADAMSMDTRELVVAHSEVRVE